MTNTQAFQFKQFSIEQDKCAMKVGTDGILLGAWADVGGVASILDIGAGTGLVAIMLAQRTEKAKITAVEIDETACAQAAQNMANSPWAGRLEIVEQPIQDFSKLAAGKNYDLIVSNPPFFSGGTFSQNQSKASVRHTIKMPHGDLLSAVRSLLAKNGKFCAVLPNMEGLRFKELATAYGLYCTHVTAVKPLENKSVERLLLQFERVEKELVRDELVIQTGGANSWTEEFRELTGAFYL